MHDFPSPFETYLRTCGGAGRLIDAIMHTRTNEAARAALDAWVAERGVLLRGSRRMGMLHQAELLLDRVEGSLVDPRNGTHFHRLQDRAR